MRHAFARHACKKEQRALQRNRPLFLARIVRICERRTARIVHQNVEPSETIDRCSNELADRVVLVEVARKSEHAAAGRAANLLRSLFNGGLRTAAYRDVHAFVSQRLCARTTEAFAGAADDRDL